MVRCRVIYRNGNLIHSVQVVDQIRGMKTYWVREVDERIKFKIDGTFLIV